MKKSKIKCSSVLVVSLCSLLLCGCGNSGTSSRSVSENKSETDVAVTETETPETEQAVSETSEVTSAVSETAAAEISEAQTEAVTEAETEPVTEALTETEAVKEIDIAEYHQIYRRQIEIFAQELYDQGRSATNMMYQLYDVDFDGVPELIISTGEAHSDRCEMYTYKNEEVTDLGDCGSYGYVEFNTQNGLLSFPYGNQGYLGYTYFKVSGSAFDKVIDFYSDAGAVGNEAAVYKINGEEVSEEEYTSRMQEYQQGNIILLGRETITGL